MRETVEVWISWSELNRQGKLGQKRQTDVFRMEGSLLMLTLAQEGKWLCEGAGKGPRVGGETRLGALLNRRDAPGSMGWGRSTRVLEGGSREHFAQAARSFADGGQDVAEQRTSGAAGDFHPSHTARSSASSHVISSVIEHCSVKQTATFPFTFTKPSSHFYLRLSGQNNWFYRAGSGLEVPITAG